MHISYQIIKSLLSITLFIVAVKASLFSFGIDKNATAGINQMPNAIIQIANAFEKFSSSLPNEIQELFLLFTSELKMLLNGTMENLKSFHVVLVNLLNKSDKLLNRSAMIPFREALHELKDNIFQIIVASMKNTADSSVSANEQIQIEIYQTLRLFIQRIEPIIQTFGNEYNDLKQMIHTVIRLYTDTKRICISLGSLIPMVGISLYLYYRNYHRLSFISENQNLNSVLLISWLTSPCLIWSLSIIIFDPFYESTLLALVVLGICCFAIIFSWIYSILLIGRQRFFFGPLLILLISLLPFIVHSYSPLCAIITSPYIYHEDNSYYYLLQTLNWIEGNCPKVNQQRCSLVDLKLVDRNDNDEMILVNKTVELLKTLPAPLFIHSEIGDYNTGKSIRQTALTRLIVNYKYRRSCSNEGIQFLIRDVTTNRASGIAGVTKGIYVIIIPSNWIDYDRLPHPLRHSMARIRKENGTLLIIDMEGANEVGGASLKTIRTLQLLTMAISSHVNVAIREHIDTPDIKELANYALLLNMVKTVSNSECGEQTNTTKSKLFALPSLSIIPKVTNNLIGFISRINYSQDGDNVFVTNVQKENDEGGPNVDLTNIFWSKVDQAKTSNLKDVDAIRSYFKGLHYLANFPPYPSRLFLYPDELKIYKNSKSIDLPNAWNRYDDWYGHWLLPEIIKPPFGLTYSLAHYVLPSIFYRMPPKQISNKLASGIEFVRLIEDLLRLLKGFDESLLESSSINEIELNVCNSVKNVVSGWKKNEIENLRKSLPIEGKSPCETEKLCDPNFEEKWGNLIEGLHRSLCMFKLYFNPSQWNNCQEKHVNEVIEQLHTELANDSKQACTYKWEKGDWSQCFGDCPGKRTRSVQCVNIKQINRIDNCCNFFLGFDKKPESTELCNISKYEWKFEKPSSCPCDTYQHSNVWCEKCDKKGGGVTLDDCKTSAINNRPPDTVRCPVCTPPAPASSCFAGHTLITMHDKSEKQISQITRGDYILTPVYQIVNSQLILVPNLYGVAQVAFVEQRQLGERSLYGINHIEPFFTSEHIFLTSKGQAVAISPLDMSIEDPSWSIDDVKQMKINETILFSLFSNDTMINNITSKLSQTIDSNIVYSLILDSVHQFYANGFLVSDLFPQLHKFPFTFILFHWLWREKSIDINHYLNESFPKDLQSYSTNDIHQYSNLNFFHQKLSSYIDEFISNQTNGRN